MTFNLTAVTDKDRMLTVFLLWGNERKMSKKNKNKTDTVSEKNDMPLNC